MRVIYHNWSATKQRPHPQSVAKISRHSVLSGDRIVSALNKCIKHWAEHDVVVRITMMYVQPHMQDANWCMTATNQNDFCLSHSLESAINWIVFDVKLWWQYLQKSKKIFKELCKRIKFWSLIWTGHKFMDRWQLWVDLYFHSHSF